MSYEAEKERTETFNTKHPIGSKVDFYPILLNRVKVEVETASKAYIVGGLSWIDVIYRGEQLTVSFNQVSPIDKGGKS